MIDSKTKRIGLCMAAQILRESAEQAISTAHHAAITLEEGVNESLRRWYRAHRAAYGNEGAEYIAEYIRQSDLQLAVLRGEVAIDDDGEPVPSGEIV